ncbi:GNAT family N-acetyltransferase [Candidatus Saccharibacteria bacterium]|jgi:hypothetical protein|nr:GNAT family N-acetyltransferase [Candidatus Saccharibacteria bacterium]MBP9131976.1 GNAT family N-acetyltransferase [Candidatus Saccharibacteria bacterium]
MTGQLGLEKNAHKYKRFVATENSIIVGFCDHDFHCELSRLYVHKDHMRESVELKLLTAAGKSLKKQGCKLVAIEATVNAKQFYEQNDYIVTKKTLHTTDKTKSPVYEMYKKLHLI